MPFEVRVFSYDDKGKRKPVKGATVTGGAGADRLGTARPRSRSPAPTLIRATHGKDIPSNGVGVCVAAVCP